MRDTVSTGGMSGVGGMLFSAVIFGYFGFFSVNWSTPGLDGEPLLFRLLLGWTLRGSAIGFAVAAALTLARPWTGHLLYAVIGLLGAVLLVTVAVMDHLDTRHKAFEPILLLLFAAWNGYGAWAGLRAVFGRR